MKWSYILFLPAIMAVAWILIILLTRRRLLRAQLVLCLSMLMVALAESMLAVYFRGRAGQLFIYDYMFELSAIFAAPVYYLGICSLSNPRGPSLRQRWTLIVPLLFSVGLTAAASHLGPRRYELMCHQWQAGRLSPLGIDGSWQWLMVWDRLLFPLLLLIYCSVMLILSRRNAHIFAVRFNEFYAEGIGTAPIDERPLSLLTWLFVPVGAATIAVVELRPFYFKYWLIGLSVVLTVLQYFMGLYIYRLRYDARSLAILIRRRMEGAVL